MPSVRGFALGSDEHVNEGNYDFAVTADFDNVNGYLAYRDDPAHRAMVSALIARHRPPGRRPVRVPGLAVLARGRPPEPPAALRAPPRYFADTPAARRAQGPERWAGTSASP